MDSKDLPLLTKMEFNVKMDGIGCAEIVRSKLTNVPGIHDFLISQPEDLVVVDAVLKTSDVHGLLESTGLLVFFKGFGSSSSIERGLEQTAAVAILKGPGEQVGLLRMVQVSSSRCIVEASVDRMPAGQYVINIHQFGDISMGADRCGEVYCVSNEIPPAGSLGRLNVDLMGVATLHLASDKLRVSSVIGRAVIVSPTESEKWVMYGVIARSAGLFQNSKRLCTCDGISIWEESQRKLS